MLAEFEPRWISSLATNLSYFLTWLIFTFYLLLFSIQITELLQKIESLEGESVAEVHQSRLELKIKELESKLELEQTTRGRMETQINRLKEAIEKLNSECDLLRSKELSSQELARKLQRQLRDLKEEHANAQQRETDSHSKKHELEKQLVNAQAFYTR